MSAVLREDTLFTSPMTTPAIDNHTLIDDGSSSDVARTVLLVASFVIGLVGVVGNGVVIIVCVRYPLRGITNVLVCNQSLIDAGTSVVFLLRYGITAHVRLSEDLNPNTANFLCKFWISSYPLWALAVASTVNLVYLNLERYIAVFHPTSYRRKLTRTRAKLLAVLPWVFGFIHELFWALLANKVEQNECVHHWRSAALAITMGVISLLNQFIIPLIIIGFVYTRIILKLRASGPSNPQEPNQKNRPMNRRISRNVIKTVGVVSLTFVVCWAPNQVVYFYSNLGGSVNRNGFLYNYTVVSALCNMCVNPFIYAFHYQNFRAKLAKLWMSSCPKLIWCARWCETNAENNGSTSMNNSFSSRFKDTNIINVNGITSKANHSTLN